MDEALATGDALPPRTRAIALYYAHTVSFWQRVDPRAAPGLAESAALFRQQGEGAGAGLASLSLALVRVATDPPDIAGAIQAIRAGLSDFRAAGDRWGEALALIPSGRMALGRGDLTAAQRDFEASLALARDLCDDLNSAIALNHLGWTALRRGEVGPAGARFSDGLRRSVRLGHDEGVAYGLEGLLAVAVLQGNAARAARLLGATEARRERLGLHTTVNAAYYELALVALRARSDPGAFEWHEADGRRLGAGDAVREALNTLDPEPGGVTHAP